MPAFLTATKFALLEQTKNRFALVLIAVFIPLWYMMMFWMVPPGPALFRLQSTGTFLQVDGRDLTTVVTGTNALTMVVGFMIFSATRSDGGFDRRLVLSGLSQYSAVAAKLTAILAVSVGVSLYASIVLLVFWPGASFGPIWAGYALDALTYGALGLLLGVLLKSELPGFFLIVMFSLMDAYLQLPVENPLANDPFVAELPSYGPIQAAVSGGFGHPIASISVFTSLEWFAGFAILALAVFWLRTRLPQSYLRGRFRDWNIPRGESSRAC